MSIFTSDEPVDLSEHMLSTYQTLRITLVVIALAVPWLLAIGDYVLTGQFELRNSMSAYYGGPMRNWFVGVLFAISGLLGAYKGFRPAENVALNLAAIFAVLTAVFPSEPGRWIHGVVAIIFFLCIAYVCIFAASATLSLVKDEKRKNAYRRTYKLLGALMVLSPVVAAILSTFLGLHTSYIFFAEAVGVYAFAIYWWVKTREIRETNADRKAAQGEIELQAGKGASDAVRELQVAQTTAS